MGEANTSIDFRVGDLSIHRVVELNAPFLPIREMLPGLGADLLDADREWLRAQRAIDAEDHVILCYQAYVVQTPHHAILVDSCLGNDKPRPRPEWHMRSDGGFLAGLAALGLTVGDIDYVMCTHLHVDHVGWNTQLVDGRWVPTFPNARYVFGAREYAATQAGLAEATSPHFTDSVLPVVEAGRADLVDNDWQIGDHVRLLPTPGHTEGHNSILFGRTRDEAVMTGDLVHSPIQLRYPELSFVRDKDLDLAAGTRRAFFERYCGTDTLCCTAHCPSPSVGRVRRWNDGFQLLAHDHS